MSSILKKIQQKILSIRCWCHGKVDFKYAWGEAKASLMLKHVFAEWKSISGGIFTGFVVAIYFIYKNKFDYPSTYEDENFIWILFSCLTIIFVMISYISGKFLNKTIIEKSTYTIAIWLMTGVINSYAFVTSWSLVEGVCNQNFSALFSVYLCLYYADHFIKIKNDYVWAQSERIEIIITVDSHKQ